jgi:hypothetical protein
MVPRDLSGRMISALVLGMDGKFTTFPGTGTAQGTFEIPNVPEGPYYLNLDGRYIITSARSIDMSVRVIGRTTQHPVATTSTLTLNVTGMNAWQPDDFVELYTQFSNMISTAIPGGSTVFTNTFFSYVDVDVRARYSLPVVFQPLAPSDADALATVSYGNPFPAAWKEHVTASVFGFKPFAHGHPRERDDHVGGAGDGPGEQLLRPGAQVRPQRDERDAARPRDGRPHHHEGHERGPAQRDPDAGRAALHHGPRELAPDGHV